VSGLRPLLRKVAYRSGALGLDRARRRHALTVVMLHRVMDPADPDAALADPTYTLSLPLFVHLLEFLRRHYAIVSLADVMVAHDASRSLPDHALLITFDDGWADNLRYAAPALKSLNIPAVVFVVPEAVLSPDDAWWQERVFAADRNGALQPWLGQCGDALSDAGSSALDVVTRLGTIDEAKRQQFLLALPSSPCRRRMMLTKQELSRLPQFGIDVGLHGYSHLPLTSVADVTAELTRAKDAIDAVDGISARAALGCPHGRYDARVVQDARSAGIKLIFTSDPCLNATQDGMLGRDQVLGRINVIERHITGPAGRLDPSAAARWLWAREVH
jgi:peptidoglycan/xylan/chitin deacetylase (PgdA/CDA1 family)